EQRVQVEHEEECQRRHGEQEAPGVLNEDRAPSPERGRHHRRPPLGVGTRRPADGRPGGYGAFRMSSILRLASSAAVLTGCWPVSTRSIISTSCLAISSNLTVRGAGRPFSWSLSMMPSASFGKSFGKGESPPARRILRCPAAFWKRSSFSGLVMKLYQAHIASRFFEGAETNQSQPHSGASAFLFLPAGHCG